MSDHTIVVIWVIKTFSDSSSVYSCHLYLIFSSSSFRSLPFLSFIVPIFAWNVPLVSLIFLKRSLVFPILLFFSISLHCSLRLSYLSVLCFGTLHSDGYIFPFLLCIVAEHNVVIVSGGQQRDSAIHIHVSTLPQTPFPSRLPHDTVGPCWLSILNIAVCTCPSQTHYPSPPATISSFGKWHYFDDCKGHLKAKQCWKQSVSPSARDKQLSVELVSPTSIPFRKWWDSSGAERYRERTCAPTNDSPAATGRRLCGCLSVEAVRLSTRHTDIWDQEFQITKCRSFIQLLICAECEVRDSEKALIGLSLNPCIVLNCDLQVYWNAKTRLHW